MFYAYPQARLIFNRLSLYFSMIFFVFYALKKVLHSTDNVPVLRAFFRFLITEMTKPAAPSFCRKKTAARGEAPLPIGQLRSVRFIYCCAAVFPGNHLFFMIPYQMIVR